MIEFRFFIALCSGGLQTSIYLFILCFSRMDQEIKLEALQILNKRKDSRSLAQVNRLRERYTQIRELFDKSNCAKDFFKNLKKY